MTIREALREARERLIDSCDSPNFEAELLLTYYLNRDRVYLHLYDNQDIEVDGYFNLIDRRANHEPYQYIINSAPFYDIDLYVADGVLIPRPETELLVDEVSKIIKESSIDNIIEIGVGSGAISIVLAREFPNLEIVATDISKRAIEIAERNIKSFGLEDRVKVIESNLIDKISTTPQLIVSNPPYIAKDFILNSNVVDYEPHTALFGGDVGDELLHKIIDTTYNRNIKYLACEMGYDQRESIREHLNRLNIESYHFYKDLAGLDRGFVVTFGDST